MSTLKIQKYDCDNLTKTKLFGWLNNDLVIKFEEKASFDHGEKNRNLKKQKQKKPIKTSRYI